MNPKEERNISWVNPGNSQMPVAAYIMATPMEQQIPDIVRFFQEKISNHVTDMAELLVNSVYSSNAVTLQQKQMETDLEKYKCIVRIQQVIMHLNSLINKAK